VSQQINLYAARLRPRHELATARNLGIVAAALLLVMTAWASYVRIEASDHEAAAALSRKQLADEQEKMTALAKMIAERRVSPALAAEVATAKANLAGRTEIMAALDSGKLGNSSGFSAFMSGFARQARNDLWLTGFAVSAGGEEIEIRGRLLDPARLPAYVQSLSGEPVFQGRRFAALEMREVDPEAQKAEASGAVKMPVPDTQPAPKLPRFVEFVLRSENSEGMDATTRSGVKR
jgi:hypothetical protein